MFALLNGSTRFTLLKMFGFMLSENEYVLLMYVTFTVKELVLSLTKNVAGKTKATFVLTAGCPFACNDMLLLPNRLMLAVAGLIST
jgi:hypothetical protein